MSKGTSLHSLGLLFSILATALALAFARQRAVQPVPDGRRPGRVRAGDTPSRRHRSDPAGPGLPGAADLDLEPVESRTLDGHT